MIDRTLIIADATPGNIARYGRYVGAHGDMPLFAEWPGVSVHGPVPAEFGSGGELLHVRMARRAFPVQVESMERHFLHSQTYLPANGRPFVMVLGDATANGLPDFAALRAFAFRDAAGIALHAGTWHEFPFAIEDDTRFTVVLRSEAHLSTLADPAYPLDARGPDLERYAIAPRARIFASFPEGQSS